MPKSADKKDDYMRNNEGEISCQFLPAGDGIGPNYVLQLLCSEKYHKIADNSATTEAREKKNLSPCLESLKFYKIFETYRNLLYKISHRFLLTTKLFSG